MNYSEAIIDVISQVPTVPDFVVISAFNRTVRRFCDTTTAFRLKVEDIEVNEGDADVTFSIPENTSVSALHLVKFDDKKLAPATDKFLASIGDKREVGRADYFLWKEGSSFRLFPAPQNDGVVTIELSLRPDRTATEIPDWFADKYYEVFIAGTCAELVRTPNTEYHNPQLFAAMEAYYNAGVTEARKEAYGADRSVPRRVRYGGY